MNSNWTESYSNSTFFIFSNQTVSWLPITGLIDINDQLYLSTIEKDTSNEKRKNKNFVNQVA